MLFLEIWRILVKIYCPYCLKLLLNTLGIIYSNSACKLDQILFHGVLLNSCEYLSFVAKFLLFNKKKGWDAEDLNIIN